MISLLDGLVSGGPVRRKIGDLSHGMLWAFRLSRGRQVSEFRLLDGIDTVGRTVIDVGANAGIWTFELSRRVGPNGLVVAYEALPHYADSLSLAMRLLRVKNVRIRSAAVGDAEQSVSLRWRTDTGEALGGLTHIELSTGGRSANLIQVPMVSLDTDLAARGIRPTEVAFVKIDVEGAELGVLRGATELLRTVSPAVFLEVEPKWLSRFGNTAEDIFGEMSNHGYVPYLSSDLGLEQTSLEAYVSQYASKRRFNNVLFLRQNWH